MRRRKINLQLQKLDKFNLVEEAEKLAKIKQETELAEKQNREVSESLAEKRKLDTLSYKDCKKIEEEHIEEVEKLENEKVSLLVDIEKKQDEYNKLNSLISNFNNNVTFLEGKIPNLKKELKYLKENKEFETLEFNKTKFEHETILLGLAEEAKKQQDILIDIDNKLTSSRQALKETIEKINEENRLMSIRRKDLEIYEKRLRVKYPDDVIL